MLHNDIKDHSIKTNSFVYICMHKEAILSYITAKSLFQTFSCFIAHINGNIYYSFLFSNKNASCKSHTYTYDYSFLDDVIWRNKLRKKKKDINLLLSLLCLKLGICKLEKFNKFYIQKKYFYSKKYLYFNNYY